MDIGAFLKLNSIHKMKQIIFKVCFLHELLQEHDYEWPFNNGFFLCGPLYLGDIFLTTFYGLYFSHHYPFPYYIFTC